MPAQPANQGKPFWGVKVSKPGVPVNRATDKQLVLKDDFSTRTWYDNQNARIVEGLLPDGSYGMLVSKPGQNATTASIGQLAFSSNASFIVALNSAYTYPQLFVPANSATQNIVVALPHNLGYIPGFAVFAGANTILPPSVAGSYVILGTQSYSAGNASAHLSAAIDNTNLYLVETVSSDAILDQTLPAIPIVYFVYSSQIA